MEPQKAQARQESVVRLEALARDAHRAGDHLLALALARVALASTIEETLRWVVEDLGHTFGKVSFELALHLAKRDWRKVEPVDTVSMSGA